MENENIQNLVKIKICGLKTPADVEKVNACAPEYVGFVFAKTKRFVTDEQAFAMKRALDKHIQAVGVFVNEPLEHVVSLCNRGVIDMAQLHGDETEAYIRELKAKTGAAVIKAVKVQSVGQVLAQMSEEADYMLFDTYKKGTLGGTGERFSLEVLQESLKQHTEVGRAIKPYFLAGGLDASNIEEIIGRISCYGVDVSTGVEMDGVKDRVKIEEFIRLVRKNVKKP